METQQLASLAAELQSELIAGAIIAIVSFIIGSTFSTLKLKIQERRGALAGDWVQRIPDPRTDNIVKVDKVSCTHHGEVVEAKITRLKPDAQAGRCWRFHGVYRGDELFGHFRTQDLKDPSYGTILMVHQGRGHFKGAYLKRKTEIIDWSKEEISLDRFPLEWIHVRGNFDVSAMEKRTSDHDRALQPSPQPTAEI